jgi:hypothetical protein
MGDSEIVPLEVKPIIRLKHKYLTTTNMQGITNHTTKNVSKESPVLHKPITHMYPSDYREPSLLTIANNYELGEVPTKDSKERGVQENPRLSPLIFNRS